MELDTKAGWKTAGVGHGYGEGYTVDVLMRWISGIEFNYCATKSTNTTALLFWYLVVNFFMNADDDTTSS